MGFLKQLFSRKAMAEGIIEANLKSYRKLKKMSPGQEEHWYLARVFKGRYPIKADDFTCLTETLQFSVLEPEDSIRALALFIQHKEMPDYYEPSWAKEFEGYMKKIKDLIESNSIVEVYKVMNPVTAGENPWLVETLEDMKSMI